MKINNIDSQKKEVLEIAKAFIEYIKTQKEILNDLINQNKTEREKILGKINNNIEDMNLGVKISELNGEIVFISAVRDRFKGRILHSFLEKVYGQEYKDELWEIQEEYENKKYTKVSKFFDLLEEKREAEKSVFSEELKEERNFEILNVNICEKPAESGEYINRDLIGITKDSSVNIALTSEIKGLEIYEPDVTEDLFLRKSAENNKNTENMSGLYEIKNNEQEIESNIKDSQKKLTSKQDNKENITNKEPIKFMKSNNTEFQKYENLKRTVKTKEEELLELINETKMLLEEKKFYKAVQNVGILAKADKSIFLNEEKIKYSLEGILLRVIRFFVPRNINNREYWEYFTSRYNEKAEFYNNILTLREYCGLRLRLENEEYEVKRTD